MGIARDEINMQEIFADLGKVCKTEASCGTCADRGCLVGYAKDCTSKCRVNQQTFMEDGMKEMPPYDIRGGYDEYDVLHTISHLLLQCRSCKQDHYENCIINIIRSCMEMIEFGEPEEYEGDPLSYMVKMRDVQAEKADVIAEEYKYVKEKRFQEQ